MTRKKLYINLIYPLVFLITFLITVPNTLAQNRKPRQLRQEVLKSKEEKPTTSIKSNKKDNRKNPPPAGVTVLQPATPTARPNAQLVRIEHSDLLYVDQERYPDIKILKGNVVFEHNNAILYCDSAYFNGNANTFDAFSNVRIVQGDTLTVYGDMLNYNGNWNLARLRYNVKMINRNTTLHTDSMYYDRASNLAYYFTGGIIEDGENTLTSMWGQYSPATKMALFKDQVVMESSDSKMTTDTLKYNTNTSIADIVGNSHVVYKEETDVYSQLGWYDTKKDRMMLLNRSLVEQKDGKTLIGDTIFYDHEAGFGEAFSKVELNDPKQKSTLYGNYVSYDRKNEIGLATDSALLVDWSSKEYLYLSADTLYTMLDSTETDTVAFKQVKASKNVRFYRNDFQGVSDSLYFSTRDSVLLLRGIPVVWSENNQVKGDKITAFTKNQEIDSVLIVGSSIMIQQDTLMYYNQLSGKEIVALLDSGAIKRVHVNGNAETIFFPKDEKTKEIYGVNKTLSSYITAYFKDEKLERVVLTTASSGKMFPLEDMGEDDLYLPNFYWFGEQRPLRKDDVFTKYMRTKPPKRRESSKRPKFPGESESATEKDDAKTSSAPTRNSDLNNSRGGQNSTNRNTNQTNIRMNQLGGKSLIRR